MEKYYSGHERKRSTLQTTTISSIKDNLGNTIHDEKCIADQLYKYFVVGPKLYLPVSPRISLNTWVELTANFNLA